MSDNQQTTTAAATGTRTTSKLYIPHTKEPGLSIVGVLEQWGLGVDGDVKGRKLALILHGTMGHKDYLFQKRLAYKLPLDSFRFDFRGNHETGGTWTQGKLYRDIEDIEIVVEHLEKKYGYRVDLVVGHSRGSLVGCKWIADRFEKEKEMGWYVPSGFINLSGRYRMRKLIESTNALKWSTMFEKQGFVEWNVTVARKPVVGRIYPEDVEDFCSWDTSFVWDRFPGFTDVLSVHGLKDQTVPVYDALIYARAFGDRSSGGTHTLNLIEDADHNFTKRQDEVVDVILQWWDDKVNSRLSQTSTTRTGAGADEGDDIRRKYGNTGILLNPREVVGGKRSRL